MVLDVFAGGSYQSQSPFTNNERLVNMHCEVQEVPGSKARIVMYPRQGLRNAVDTALGRSRAIYAENGRMWEVRGTSFIEWYDGSPMTYSWKGAVLDDGKQATISSNGIELFITAGEAGYLFNLTSGVFGQILSPNFPGASRGAFLDGYFIALKPNSRQVNVSALYDGTTWPADALTVLSQDVDNLVGMIVDHNQLWLFGNQNSHVYQDDGDPVFPFSSASSPGSQIENGCAAAFSIVQLDNTIFYLGADERGRGIVWRLNGYLPQRISTHAIEFAIQGYDEISDAIAWTYQDQGHLFYVLYFPSADTDSDRPVTWQYDVSTGLWNEMEWLDVATGIGVAHRAATHVFAFNKHLVGDRANGKLYEASIDALDDDGVSIERIRQFPHISVEQKWIFYQSLQLDMQVGIGLDGIEPPVDPAPDPVNYNPKVQLNYSDDAGHSWSNDRLVAAGRLGQYKKRVRWLRLGKSRDRIFRIKMTEAVRVAWIAAYLEFKVGTS